MAKHRCMFFLSAMLVPAVFLLPAAAQQMEMQDMPGMKMSGDQTHPKEEMQDPASGLVLKLSDAEEMALSRNPTLTQANADVRSAEGVKKQAGLYPNPTVGYYGDEIRGGAFRSGKEGAYVNQTIVLGGKLSAARQTAEQQRMQAETNVEAQRTRVLTNVRRLYYGLVATQRMVQLRGQLCSLAKDAVQTAHQLGNVGQADQPDVLQAEVESEQAELALDTAKKDYQSLWETLAATVGNPALQPGRVEGDLEDFPQLDQQEWLAKMLSDSPQAKYAQQEADRAKAALREAKKVAIPDLQISANLSQDNEPLDPSTKRTGIVGGAQVGVQLPIFDRNQGNVQKAKADVERSQAEVLRIQLDLRRQMSLLFRNYDTAHMAAGRYRDSMLPRAQKAYELYKSNYQNMAAAYPQVLIAQRTLFQLQVDYVQALETVWRNAHEIEGYGFVDGLTSPSTVKADSISASQY